MSTFPKYIPTLAFIAGIALTLGFKDFYPDLERRFRRGRRDVAAVNSEPQIGDRLQIIEDSVQAQGVTRELGDLENVQAIREGIEGCIGNTPLFRIKSLSEETECEILAKAEVGSNSEVIGLELMSG